MLWHSSDKNPLSAAIKREVYDRQQNYILLTVGRPQTFKSLSNLTIAKNIDSEFDFHTRMAKADSREFVKILNNQPLHRGSVVMFDEIGAGLPAKEFWSVLNKAVGEILETWGHEGIVALLTTPVKKFFDIHARTLINGILETLKADKKHGIARLKFHEIEYNQRFDEFYYKRAVLKSGWQSVKQNVIKVHIPPKEVIQEYMNVMKPVKIRIREQAEMKITKAEDQMSLSEMGYNYDSLVNKAISMKLKPTTTTIEAMLKIPYNRARIVKILMIDKMERSKDAIPEGQDIS